MVNIKYVLFLIFSVFISAVSQILLKKSALESHSSWIREYLNVKVVLAYLLFFCAVLIDLLALRYVPVSFVPVIETSSYIFVIFFSRFMFKEKISLRQYLAIMLILAGITIYVI